MYRTRTDWVKNERAAVLHHILLAALYHIVNGLVNYCSVCKCNINSNYCVHPLLSIVQQYVYICKRGSTRNLSIIPSGEHHVESQVANGCVTIRWAALPDRETSVAHTCTNNFPNGQSSHHRVSMTLLDSHPLPLSVPFPIIFCDYHIQEGILYVPPSKYAIPNAVVRPNR